MSSKKKHLEYIKQKGSFVVDCSHAIFSDEEILFLEKYGHWLQALANGILEPITELQKEFILVAKKEKAPFSFEEQAWNKYIHRKAMEENPDNKLNLNYTITEDGFYNREMAKQQKSMMFKLMNETHRK